MSHTALRGAAAYDLPWLDAHLRACPELHGMEDLPSEDFQNSRLRRFGGEWSLVTPRVMKTSQPDACALSISSLASSSMVPSTFAIRSRNAAMSR